MATRSNSRFERSSFQGLSIIEGERSDEPVSASNDLRLSKQRNERRRRSSSLAQSHQIQEIIAKTVEELTLKGNGDAAGPQHKTAEDRLKEVLISAKESGFSSDRIFSILGKTLDGDRLEKHSFIEGLQKLGYKCIDEEELSLISRFDLNGDGLISLAEFQHYCYHEVPSVAWKAERQRMEKAAGEVGADGAVVDESRFDIKEIVYAAGQEVHHGTKLFWKQGVSINVTLRYCRDLDFITMEIQNAESMEEYKTLYIAKSACAVDQETLEEAANLAVQASDEQTDEGNDLIRNKIHWELFSSYLCARLQLRLNKDGESYQPSLAKLHGDEFDTLDIEKPSNLAAPQRRSERHSAGASGKSIEAEFQSKVKSFRRESRSARTSRQSAQELSSIVESALNEIILEDSM